MHSRQELADGFRNLGVAPGDTVMLHASVRAVGEVAGGPDQIHLALKDALTAAGSLMMYASCSRSCRCSIPSRHAPRATTARWSNFCAPIRGPRSMRT
jgi:aminoglycoside N3'-acetyltransferase